MNLYTVIAKTKPEVWDKGTQYAVKVKCQKCDGGISEIVKLGAFLPNRDRSFGLVTTINGIIGTERSIEYLRLNDINEFTTEEANVTFGKTNSITDKFYWLKPNNIFELDTENGPGPVIVCEVCGRRMWKDKNLTLPRLKYKVESDFFQIKYTWVIIVTEKFIEVAKKVPDGCYLEFEPWYYEE